MKDVAAVRSFPRIGPGGRPDGANAAPAGFGELFSQALEKVNAQLLAADAKVGQLVAGERVELHDVMITLEEAKLALSLAVEVRNRLMEAYQELSRMQV